TESMCFWRSASSEPKGKTSLSWNVKPQAPRSASFRMESAGSRSGRVAVPKGSLAGQPTVHRPKEYLMSLTGSPRRGAAPACGAALVVRLNYYPRLGYSQGVTTAGTAPETAARSGSAAARQHSLREHNLELVARAVFEGPEPLSRAGVAASTGLARATVSTLVDQLVAAGLVRELPAVTGGRAGRPAVPLVPARRTVVGLGLEVNVDYLGVRALDLTGEVVADRVLPGSFHDSDPAAVLGRLGDLAREVSDEVTAAGMTVAGGRLALPGLVDPRAGLLQVAPNLGWSSLEPVPLLGLDLDVQVANEAKLGALAELAGGSDVAAPDSFVFVSGDVGIGAAIVVDRRLFLGERGWNGEIGHVVVDPAGPRCSCG